VLELNRLHIHAQCVNWSAGISNPHYRACPLIGSFLLGFTYCGGRERKSIRNIIFRCSFIGNFSLGFHIVTTRNVFYVWLWYKTLGNLINTRGLRPPRINHVASCFDALSITYKSFALYIIVIVCQKNTECSGLVNLILQCPFYHRQHIVRSVCPFTIRTYVLIFVSQEVKLL
jgi:hypothetical protein